MDSTVMLGHGSGGTMMKRIIDEVFFEAYAGEDLLRGDDAAVLANEALAQLGEGAHLAFSTDSFVVTPHFFPGGDIGRLAVCPLLLCILMHGIFSDPCFLFLPRGRQKCSRRNASFRGYGAVSGILKKKVVSKI